jgi:hypothetical protein
MVKPVEMAFVRENQLFREVVGVDDIPERLDPACSSPMQAV